MASSNPANAPTNEEVGRQLNDLIKPKPEAEEPVSPTEEAPTGAPEAEAPTPEPTPPPEPEPAAAAKAEPKPALKTELAEYLIARVRDSQTVKELYGDFI